MKSHGTIDFTHVQNFKIEKGPVFPTENLEVGFFFWLTSEPAGPYAWNGVKWRPFFDLELGNGRPAYIEPIGNVLTSVDSIIYQYTLASLLGLSSYMNINSGIVSSTMGYAMPVDALIRRVTMQSSAAVGSACSFQIRKVGSSTPIASMTLPQGTKFKAQDLSLKLNAGDEIAMYVTSGSALSNMVATLEVGWR